jgi:hypothetical protein
LASYEENPRDADLMSSSIAIWNFGLFKVCRRVYQRFDYQRKTAAARAILVSVVLLRAPTDR